MLNKRPSNRARYQCEPIANLETRKQQYWGEVWSALSIVGPVAIVAIFVCLAAIQYLGAPWTNAAFVCAAILGPMIWFFWPVYPTEHDIESDRRLRRSAGLPDDVEPD